MRQGAVYMNGKLAGILTEISPTEYVFKYDDTYYADDMQPAVSLTLPKTQPANSASVRCVIFNILRRSFIALPTLSINPNLM